MSKKIIGIIHPFVNQQTLSLYDDGEEIESVKVELSQIPETIFRLAESYGVSQIDFSGSEQFIKGIIKQIKTKEFTKYNANNLIFKCI